jgi:hypothetical protein
VLALTRRQIALVDPKILVCLGAASAQTLLGGKEGRHAHARTLVRLSRGRRRVRTCSSLAGIGLVCFVIRHTFGIWQAFGDALPGPAVAPGRLQLFDDRPSSPYERIGPSGPAVGVVDPEWSMRHAGVARSRRRRMISAVKPDEPASNFQQRDNAPARAPLCSH